MQKEKTWRQRERDRERERKNEITNVSILILRKGGYFLTYFMAS